MQTVCNGAPQKGTRYGGMWGQLRRLMRRVHPRPGEVMQEHCNTDGSPWEPGMKLYANLKTIENPETPPKGFYRYVPEVRPTPFLLLKVLSKQPRTLVGGGSRRKRKA